MSLSSRSGAPFKHKSSSLLLNTSLSTLPTPSSAASSSRSLLSDDDPFPWQNDSVGNSSGHSTSANTSFSGSFNVSTTPPSHSSATNASTPSNSNSYSYSNNTLESLIAMAHKRIATFVYLKKVHEGKHHWFNTILLSRSDLEKWFNHNRMIRRTNRFAILGLSLSSLLDIITFQDFLRGLLTLLTECESIPDDHLKPRMANLPKGIFRQATKSGRKSSGPTDYPISIQDSSDTSFLFSPNIPFELDYFEVWITLCDILVEVYQKMIMFMSPDSDHHLGHHSPRPCSSFNSSGYLGHHGGINLSVSVSSQSQSQSHHISQSSIEMITKVDHKLKKLINLLTKEIDGIARSSIRDELAQLDPMLNYSSIYTTPHLDTSQTTFSDHWE